MVWVMTKMVSEPGFHVIGCPAKSYLVESFLWVCSVPHLEGESTKYFGMFPFLVVLFQAIKSKVLNLL